MDAIAHAARRDGKHASQVAAPQHADRVSRRTRSVCSWRNRRSFSRRAGRLLARIAIASSAAFMAPGLPIARVPTGMPPGIWTIDSSESIPFRAWLSTGTPSTGSRVYAATIPGRCAAPPAPATITSKPRSSAVEAYSTAHAGVRWAETIWHSWGTSNRASVSAAWRMVSQSDLLPMTTPTRGVAGSFMLSMRNRLSLF
jgi:hypothetical protein